MYNICTDLKIQEYEKWNIKDLYWFHAGPGRGLVLRR